MSVLGKDSINEEQSCSSSLDPDFMNSNKNSDSSELESEYYFETDSLLLKNNPDYQQLLRCKIKLQAQRTVAVKNLEQLLELWDYGIKNPMKFLEDFTAGCLNMPERITISELPEIDWSKYDLSSNKGGLRHNTHKRIAATRSEPAKTKQKQESYVTVRSRLCNNSKPQTFNQPWTPEEQRRLDELLVVFPPEYIAANRYRKIATELGTRTAIQVQSRLQKYSVALKKNKIALPGYRNSSANGMRWQSSLSRRCSHWQEPQSTFLALHDTHVPHVTEDWDRLNVKGEDIGSEEQRRVSALQRLRGWVAEERQDGRVVHHTYTCFVCQKSPIEGVRHHCCDCSRQQRRLHKQQRGTAQHHTNVSAVSPSPQQQYTHSVDFCQECFTMCTSGGAGAALRQGHDVARHKVLPVRKMQASATLARLIAGDESL